MSRITDPKWRNTPNQAHIMVIQDIGPFDAKAKYAFWNWCYENCKGKVIALKHEAEIVLDKCERNDSRGNKFHTFSYGEDTMVVIVEDAEDAMLIKLTWGGV